MGQLWTEDRIEQLKQGWANGDSAAVIAARIGGVSRNAVIGKVHRLRLDGREPRQCPGISADKVSVVSMTRTSRVRKSGPDPVALAKLAAIMSAPKPPSIETIKEPTPLNLTLMELGHRECRYPVDGEKERTLFCANATSDDSPYCTYHHKLCHGHGTHSERNVEALLRRVA